MLVTVSCAEGDTGMIYDGLLETEVSEVQRGSMPDIPVKVMMNVGNPGEAFALSFLPNDGVGLAREEFIISNFIKIHPLALWDFHFLREIDDTGYIDNLYKNHPAAAKAAR